ncbi:MAG: hypothetical protein RBR08_02900 [Desulforegulaceae bacterium]|nr:hypothetical protein [Desulforegulaceae bacterium]
MKSVKFKIILFFSLGLNAGFIIFLVFHLISVPLSPKKAFLHMSENAVSDIKLNNIDKKNLESEIKNFHLSMKNAYTDIHSKRMEILSLYSQKTRDENKIKALKNQLESGIDTKEMLFMNHIEKIDSILKKNAPKYFNSIHKQLEEHFKKKI